MVEDLGAFGAGGDGLQSRVGRHSVYAHPRWPETCLVEMGCTWCTFWCTLKGPWKVEGCDANTLRKRLRMCFTCVKPFLSFKQYIIYITIIIYIYQRYVSLLFLLVFDYELGTQLQVYVHSIFYPHQAMIPPDSQLFGAGNKPTVLPLVQNEDRTGCV